MSEEITASFTFEPAYMEPGFKWHARAMIKQRPFFRRLSRVMVLLIGLGSLAMLLLLPRATTMAYTWTLALFALSPVFVFGFDWMAKVLASRSVTRSPSLGLNVHFAFSDEGIQSQTEGANGTVAWRFVLESVITPDGALIYTHKGMFHWLAITSFTSEAEYNRFLDLLAAKTKHSKLK
jgi:hypothetical protein